MLGSFFGHPHLPPPLSMEGCLSTHPQHPVRWLGTLLALLRTHQWAPAPDFVAITRQNKVGGTLVRCQTLCNHSLQAHCH